MCIPTIFEVAGAVVHKTPTLGTHCARCVGDRRHSSGQIVVLFNPLEKSNKTLGLGVILWVGSAEITRKANHQRSSD